MSDQTKGEPALGNIDPTKIVVTELDLTWRQLWFDFRAFQPEKLRFIGANFEEEICDVSEVRELVTDNEPLLCAVCLYGKPETIDFECWDDEESGLNKLTKYVSQSKTKPALKLNGELIK